MAIESINNGGVSLISRGSLLHIVKAGKLKDLSPDVTTLVLTAIFHYNPGKLVPECFRSGFYWS